MIKKLPKTIIDCARYNPKNEDEKMTFMANLKGDELSYETKRKIISLLDFLKEKGLNSSATITINSDLSQKKIIYVDLTMDCASLRIGKFFIYDEGGDLVKAFENQLSRATRKLMNCFLPE